MARYKYNFSESDFARLRAVIRTSKDGRSVKRAVALRALEAGLSMREAAAQAEMSQATIYRWAARFLQAPDQAAVGLQNKRLHLPRHKRNAAKAAVETLMQTTPAALGYRHSDWTVDLLREQLALQGVAVSDDTVRTVLHELGYRWKRPRFVLIRQSPTWRQAKGGSNADFRAVAET